MFGTEKEGKQMSSTDEKDKLFKPNTKYSLSKTIKLSGDIPVTVWVGISVKDENFNQYDFIHYGNGWVLHQIDGQFPLNNEEIE